MTDLRPGSSPEETSESGTDRDPHHHQPIFSVMASAGGSKPQEEAAGGPAVPSGSASPPLAGAAAATTTTTTTSSSSSDAESGFFSVAPELCAEHESELDWFCGTERKLICVRCATAGPCRGHTVGPLAAGVTAVRNRLVDVCEKIQLQAQRIEKFIDQTLAAKEQNLQTAASTAREQVVARVNAAREALEEEEQRLLEEVHREEERVEQCLLTQRAHWSQALASLAQTRSRLVHTLTHTPDTLLVTSLQEIDERVEESEGVGEPRDTEQLNLNAACSHSHLLRALWTSAMLLAPRAVTSPPLQFDPRTVSPLLSLSDDRRTLTFANRKQRAPPPPYDPARFDYWPNALGSPAVASGWRAWLVDVGQSGAFKVGVCYAALGRKGSGDGARLGHNAQSWVLSHYDGEYSFCHAGRKAPLRLARRPARIGLLLDWSGQTLTFYEPESAAVLHAVAQRWDAPLLPAFAVSDRSVTIVH